MDYLKTVKQRFNSFIGNYQGVEFVINGYQLSPSQMESFKRLTGLLVLEPGHYWLDPETGAMGVVGVSFPFMNIYQHYIQQMVTSHGSQPSLSERRQLFNSADLTGIWGVY